MSNYLTALRAEFLKKRKTSIYYLCFFMGAIIPLLYFIARIFFDKTASDIPGIPFNLFEKLIETNLTPLGSFFLPLVIILTAVRIAHIDHKNRGWELMDIQPLSKFSVYFSKFTILLIGNIICIASFLFMIILTGLLLPMIHTQDINAVMALPIGYFMHLFVRVFVATLFLSSIMFLLAVLFTNYIVPLFIGFLALLGTLILSGFNIETVFNPFTILSRTSAYPEGSELGHFFLYTEILSLIGFASITAVGFIYFLNKTFRRTFFRRKSLVKIATILVVGVGLSYLIHNPNSYKPYNQTVVSGAIESNQSIDRVVLYDEFTNDTLSVIPVSNNRFHQSLTNNLPLDKYQLLFIGQKGRFRFPVIMSSKDSIDIAVRYYNGETEVKSLTGTRLAENEYRGANYFPGMIYSMGKGDEFLTKPKDFAALVYKEWKDVYERSNTFRTRDNYALRPDFIRNMKIIETASILKVWNDFFERAIVVNPDIASQVPDEIKEMKELVPLNENNLISNNEYFDYVMSELTVGDTTDSDFLLKRLHAIQKLPASGFRDRLLFAALKSSLDGAVSNTERQELMAVYSPAIQNERIRRSAHDYFTTVNRIATGNPAPGFRAFNPEGTPFDLSDLRGKFIVIDVWATWCGPCLFQSPYFERVALKYKGRNDIAFIALSIDENKPEWLIQSKKKSKSVMQLHIPIDNQKEFTTDYNIQAIPRFIFIDKEGNFIDSEMSLPYDNKFETTIIKELGRG